MGGYFTIRWRSYKFKRYSPRIGGCYYKLTASYSMIRGVRISLRDVLPKLGDVIINLEEVIPQL